MPAGENSLKPLLAIAALMLLLFVLVVIFLIRHYKKKHESSILSIQAIKADYENNLLSTRLEIQEDALQHVSREIHDNINLALTLAKLHLTTVNWTNKEVAEEKVKSSHDLLSESIEKLRDISRSLNSDLISSLGLIAAIEREVERIQKTNLFQIQFAIQGNSIYLPTEKELIIFRIIQECFNNIIKHSNTKLVQLTITYLSGQLHILIMDHGVGFNVDETEESKTGKGAGLSNLKTRVKMIGGQMKIASIINEGTTLAFTIPFSHENSTV